MLDQPPGPQDAIVANKGLAWDSRALTCNDTGGNNGFAMITHVFFLWTKYLRILEPELGLCVQNRWWTILFWFRIYNSCKDPHKNGIWEVPRMADDVCFIAVKCKLRDMNIVNPIAIFPLINLRLRINWVTDWLAEWTFQIIQHHGLDIENSWKFLVNQSGADSIHWNIWIFSS